ncbi:MAG: YHYH protein [Chloroflexota bacterium]
MMTKRQFWVWMRNFSAVGAISMFALAFVAAQTNIDLMRLPVGDGNVTAFPQVGAVYNCDTEFNNNIGGATAQGPWFNGDGTFDFTGKFPVDGAVSWPGELTITVSGNTRILDSNGLPSIHTTGTFPVARNDDAYQYDRNPNTIEAQDYLIELPANPAVAAEPGCLNMSAIGMMLTGVVFFNAVDAQGRDAVAWETQDACEGHPEMTGEYHYHNLATCAAESLGVVPDAGHSPLVGYAYDGFGLYGFYGDDGEAMTNDDLDECHGHTHTVEWDGEMVEIYHYHATFEYPYTLGCYRGEPVVSSRSGPGGGQGQRPPGGGSGNPPRPRPGGGG